MDTEQERLYRSPINAWITAVKKVPGWDEDQVSMATNAPFPVLVTMPKYFVAGTFCLVAGESFFFSNPSYDISIKTDKVPKCNLNRFCRTIDETPHVDSPFLFTKMCIERLREIHDGSYHEVKMSSVVIFKTTGHMTGVPSSVEVPVTVTARCSDRGEIVNDFEFTVSVHTVCPFMLKEADGHSHTQRAYITTKLNELSGLASMQVIIDELVNRFQIPQSSMKIPDEAVHVLRAYTVPTYTEDGAFRFIRLLRDTKHRWAKLPAEPIDVEIMVRSLESIFTTDIIARGAVTI
jgi:GTP cyclohydrolase FolE2